MVLEQVGGWQEPPAQLWRHRNQGLALQDLKAVPKASTKQRGRANAPKTAHRRGTSIARGPTAHPRPTLS